MMFNSNKAGLEKVDKVEVNRIIEEASKGTPFWEHQKRRDERHAERIQKTLQKLAAASPKELADAKQWAASVLERFDADLQDIGANLRHIVHVDLDAFYASVEERDDPRLREVPMAVGCTSMLSTSNYAARKFGVRAGLPGFIAKKLCPQLVIVPLKLEKYEQASHEVMSILKKFDPNLVIFGLDEAALDITDYCRSASEDGLSPDEAVNQLRKAVRETTGLTCSAGIAPNGLLAKICADVKKPDGQFRLDTLDNIKTFLAPLGVRKIPGIGQVQEKILSALGVETCGDLLENGDRLLLAFGERSAEGYLRAAKGIGSTFGQDEKATSSGRSRKSKSAEATFHDSADSDFLADVVKQLCTRLAEELVAANLRGRLVTLKLKMASFDVFSRSIALEIATNDESTITKNAQRILKFALNRRPGQAMRLLGVKMSNFEDERAESHSTGRQTTLSQILAKPPADKAVVKGADTRENADASTYANDNINAEEIRSSPENVLSDADEEDHSSAEAVCSEVAQRNWPEQTSESENEVFSDQNSRSSDAGNNTAHQSSTDSTRQDVGSSVDNTCQNHSDDTKSSDVPENMTGSTCPESQRPSTSGDVLIRETYCPICAIIMRDVSERHVNRHIDECLRREQKREKDWASPSKIVQSRAATSASKIIPGTHSQAKSKGPVKRKATAVESKSQTRRPKQPTQGSISSFFNR